MSWSSERLCAKVVSFCSERGLTEYAQFLLSDLVKRSQTTLHTASNTTVTLKSGTMLRGGEAHDHRRANRNPGGERTGSHRQRSAGVSGATRTDRTPLSASRGARAGRSFPDKLAERG